MLYSPSSMSIHLPEAVYLSTCIYFRHVICSRKTGPDAGDLTPIEEREAGTWDTAGPRGKGFED